MKSKLFKVLFTFAALLLSVSVVIAQKPDKDKSDKENKEAKESVRTIAADAGIVITMCLESGNVAVIGVDRRDVRVTAEHAAHVTLRTAKGANSTDPATRLEVVVTDSSKAGARRLDECHGTSNLDLEVPRGATLYVTTRDGDIEISNVSEVRAETSSGNINLQRIAKAVEAASVSGDISMEESNGRLRLRSISGNIDALRAKVVEENDFLFVKSVSGDVRLEDIAQPRVDAGTITGEISLTGPLARGGFYGFNTVTGDVTLNMPTSVSFEVTALVSQGGEVITDFPLKYTEGISTVDIISSGKLTGTYGTGPAPAKINLFSFSGTLRLRKK